VYLCHWRERLDQRGQSLKLTTVRHVFVEYRPEKLEEGVVYVSIEFRTAVHHCCCGCGNLVVTPLSPVKWKLGFDGVSISLSPSIGNWGFPCRSHYWIKDNQVVWDDDWDDDRIERTRRKQEKEHDAFFAKKEPPADEKKPRKVKDNSTKSGLSRFSKWWKGRKH
jgi:hypothetical protein